MKPWDTVAIVGVGLIGGSIGRDLLAQRLARRVVGIGHRSSSLRQAKSVGAVTETTLNLAAGVAEADFVVVCTPVGRIVDDVRAVAAAAKPGTLVTDVGSTKGSIVAALEAPPLGPATFVGSHPLAGSEKSGPAAAVEGLFEKRVVVVTPTTATPAKALRTIESFWKRLGAEVLRMDPVEHDRALAATSHVPHVAASALSGTTPSAYLKLTAGGWLDSTRIAAADGPLWRQILDDNRANVAAALAALESRLAAFRRAIETRNEAELERLLADGKRIREAAARVRKPKR